MSNPDDTLIPEPERPEDIARQYLFLLHVRMRDKGVDTTHALMFHVGGCLLRDIIGAERAEAKRLADELEKMTQLAARFDWLVRCEFGPIVLGDYDPEVMVKHEYLRRLAGIEAKP